MRGYILRDEEKEAEIKKQISELTKEAICKETNRERQWILGWEHTKLLDSIENKFMVVFIKGEFVILEYNSTYFMFGHIPSEKDIAFDIIKQVYKDARKIKEVSLAKVDSGCRLYSVLGHNKEDRLNAMNLKYSEVNYIYSNVHTDFCIKTTVLFDRIVLNDLSENYLNESIKKMRSADFISDENKKKIEADMRRLYNNNMTSHLTDWEVVRSTNEIIEQINKRK